MTTSMYTYMKTPVRCILLGKLVVRSSELDYTTDLGKGKLYSYAKFQFFLG